MKLCERKNQLAKLRQCWGELNLSGKPPPQGVMAGWGVALNPNKKRNTLETAIEHFWKNVTKGETCWIWTGTLFPSGYGRLWLNWRSLRAHRFSYMLHFGLISPRTAIVCHSCDTPACVNPNHLFLGTNEINTHDSIAKGRRNPPRGERHWNSVLTADDVRQIRATYSRQKGNGGIIAKEYGVDYGCIRAILIRRTWRHVK